MRPVIKCPSCGHNANDHRMTTLKREKPYRPKRHVQVESRPEGVCGLSKSFLKRTLVAKK